MAQVSLQELRLYWGTTFNTAYVSASNDGWNITNTTKFRITKIDKSGLKEAGIVDETLQTRLHGAPAPFRGLRTGNLKVTTWLGGGSSSTTADAYATTFGKMMGGLATPGAKSITIGAGSSTSNIVCADALTAFTANGMGVLINGEARVATNVQSGWFVLNMALTSAPAENATGAVAHTAYFDEAETVNYCDWLAIGKSTTDQRQGIGCQGTFKLSGLAPGEAPKTEIDFSCADHQVVPADERATLAYATTPGGSDPPTGKSFGGFMIADAGTQVAKATMRAGKFAADMGIAWTKKEDPNGVNGIGGWIRNPSHPTFAFTSAIDEDHLGLVADFQGKTAKQIMLQLGTAAGKAVLIYYPRWFVDEGPTDEALNNEAGLKVSGHGDDNLAAGTSECVRSAASIHFF